MLDPRPQRQLALECKRHLSSAMLLVEASQLLALVLPRRDFVVLQASVRLASANVVLWQLLGLR